MYAEYSIVDHDRQGKVVKHVRKVRPDRTGTVLAHAFGVEPIRLCDSTGFVVPSDQVDSVGVTKLETGEKGNSFDAEETAVDIVP